MMFHPWGPPEPHRGLQQSPWLDAPSWQVFTLKKGRKVLFHVLFSALFLMTTPSAATWTWCWSWSRLGLQSTRHTRTTSGHSSCNLQPSASSSLEMPTFLSSSVSEGCNIFHRDALMSEHSQTNFSKFRSALTEK